MVSDLSQQITVEATSVLAGLAPVMALGLIAVLVVDVVTRVGGETLTSSIESDLLTLGTTVTSVTAAHEATEPDVGGHLGAESGDGRERPEPVGLGRWALP
jgi:hypothetical protein